MEWWNGMEWQKFLKTKSFGNAFAVSCAKLEINKSLLREQQMQEQPKYLTELEVLC